MDIYLSVNHPPVVKNSLTTQFQKIIEKPKVTQKIDFQFSEDTFIDADGDSLTYSIKTILKISKNGSISTSSSLD
jgi:hypothetical protein